MSIMTIATGFFWILTFVSFSSGSGSLVCAFLPIALGMTYVSWQVLTTDRARASSQAMAIDHSRPTKLRILRTGSDWVEFTHPEGGSWSYGMTDDLRAVGGLESVEFLGGGVYRMNVSRRAGNAARVLEAAYLFRRESKTVQDGVVYLNDCPGYDVLMQEASYDYD